MTDELELPNDMAAEMSAVGAAILSPTALADVTAVVPVDGWYRPKHATIIAAAQAVVDRGEGLDPVTVSAELEHQGLLGKVGGAPYLHTLMATVPTAANAGYYAEIVADKAALRQVIVTGRRLTQLGFNGAAGADVDEVVDRARAELDAVADHRRPGSLTSFAELLDATVDAYTRPFDPGIPTPWPDVDDLIGGLAAGTMTVIGARPGVGKTVLGGNIGANVAAGDVGVLLNSLEMPAGQLMHRLIAAEAGVEFSRLARHQITDQDWDRIARAANALRELPLTIDDRANVSVAHIRSQARELRRTGLGLVIVDYLQLIRPADPRAVREQQVAAISRSLKLLARDLQVAVVALAQLNRAHAQRAAARPRLEDLRESGAIESDADAVLLLHLDPQKPGELQVEVAKNRHGPCGHVALQWAPYYARARSLVRS